MPDPTPANSMQPDPLPVVKFTTSKWSILSGRTGAGLLLIALPLVAQHFGLVLDDAATQQIVEQLFQAAGLVLATYGRLMASKVLVTELPTEREIRRAILPETPTRSDSGLAEPRTLTEDHRGLHHDNGCAQAPALAALFLAALFLAAAVLWLTACASDTRSGRVTNAVALTAAKFAGRVLITSVSQLASDHARGLELDYAHAASAGLWTNAESIITSDDLTRIVNAWAGPAPAPLAAPLAAQWDALQPRTPGDRTALVASMAAGISDAAVSLKTFRGFVAGAEGKDPVP